MRRAALALALLAASCDDAPTPDAGVDAGPPPMIGETVDPSTLGLAADPAGEWLAGDLHVHATGASNDAGEESTPERIKEVAMERGLFFVVLTDHSNSTGSDPTTRDENPALFNMGPEFPYWDRAAELSEDGVFLMIDGNELSPIAEGEMPTEPTGHVGCLPEDLESFDRDGAFTDRPRGSQTLATTIEQAHARGCFAVLNHPYGTIWISADWTSFDYDAMEIWNGTAGFGLDDRQGTEAWRCDWVTGRRIPGVGASDNHRVNDPVPGTVLDPALGFPKTRVFATARTWPAIMEGIRAARTTIGEGDSELILDGYAEDGARDGGHWLRVRGALDAEARSATLVVHRTTACADTRATDRGVDLTSEVILERSIASGDTFDWAVEIGGEAGVYTAEMIPRDGHWGALSNAVVVE